MKEGHKNDETNPIKQCEYQCFTCFFFSVFVLSKCMAHNQMPENKMSNVLYKFSNGVW